MKKLSFALSLLILLSVVTGCVSNQPAPSETTALTQPNDATVAPFRDYVPELELNMASETVKLEASVKLFVDGDTVHFHVDDPAFPSGLLKARFLVPLE